MFDCVIPTRNARNGSAFTRFGRINIKNAGYSRDELPVDEECSCGTCRKYSRAYLRHLFLCKELSVYRMISIHNLFFYQSLMEKLRSSVREGTFEKFRREFYDGWFAGGQGGVEGSSEGWYDKDCRGEL